MSATAQEFTLPTVAGRKLRGSNNDFERACLVHVERLQHGLGDYDSAMLDTFCEAVRLVREYSDAMQMRQPDLQTALIQLSETWDVILEGPVIQTNRNFTSAETWTCSLHPRKVPGHRSDVRMIRTDGATPLEAVTKSEAQVTRRENL